MDQTKAKKLASLLQDAQEYLDQLDRGEADEKDYLLQHGYLTAFVPELNEPKVPAVLPSTVARLYYASECYQEAAVLLKRLKGDALGYLLHSCDFFSGYSLNPHDWLSRQHEIWAVFREAEKSLTEENADQTLLSPWDFCFPAQRVYVLSPPDSEWKKVLLGSPDGIYSLFPMNYLIKHKPASLSERWEVSLDARDIATAAFAVNDILVDVKDFRVSISPSEGSGIVPKVDLQLWHPKLQDLASRCSGKAMAHLVNYLRKACLSATVSALYVGKVSLAEAPLTGETMPLSDLEDWLLDHDMDPDIPLRQALRQRVYAFNREPVMVSRPRGDIVRGETCMPELEEIYFLRDGKGLAVFQRYGVGCWFLTIPKKVCGEDFPAFRDALIAAVRAEEGDTVCFTGWAEGTRNCYLDLLSLSSMSMLRTMRKCLQDLPGGREIRISTFYWNSTPRSVDADKELSKYQDLMHQLLRGENLPPVEEQVSPRAQSNLAKAFRNTRWKKLDEPAGWDMDSTSHYDEAKDLLEDMVHYIFDCNLSDAPFDYRKLTECLRQVLPIAEESPKDDDFLEQLSSIFMTLERYRECAKWASQISASATRIARLYTCDVGSGYPNGLFPLETRRQAFWKQFSAAEYSLSEVLAGSGNPAALQDFLDQAEPIFPTGEIALLPAGPGQKNTFCTGLPGGMLTLPAMLYFTSHYPASINRRWNIAVSRDGIPCTTIPVDGAVIPVQDIQVSLADEEKVSLALWHPALAKLAAEDAEKARNTAVQMVNAVLPMGARLLYVADITAAEAAPEESFPLPELEQQMQAIGFQTEIHLDTLLSRRRYSIFRLPKDTGRPRDDILRGETCMPELERIYHRLYEDGQAILERHGLFAMSLMIPNGLCNGNPAQYRLQIQNTIRHAEGDQVFFTGWAEGSKYCYVDLITMDGTHLLHTLNEYALGNPGGRDLRFCSFYWNSTPRSWIAEEAEKDLTSDSPLDYESFARAHMAPDFPVPDAAAAEAFEASFHPEFKPEDFRAPKAAPAAAPAAKNPLGGNKKLSKAQRNALNSKNAQNNKGGKGGKNKKKR